MKSIENQTHHFVIILLHFTTLYVFVVAYVYCIYMVEILYGGVLLHISFQSNVGRLILATMGIFTP